MLSHGPKFVLGIALLGLVVGIPAARAGVALPTSFAGAHTPSPASWTYHHATPDEVTNGFPLLAGFSRPFNFFDNLNRTQNPWHMEFEVVNSSGLMRPAGAVLVRATAPLGTPFAWRFPYPALAPGAKFAIRFSGPSDPAPTTNNELKWYEGTGATGQEYGPWKVTYTNGGTTQITLDAGISECSLTSSCFSEPLRGPSHDDDPSPSTWNGIDPFDILVEIEPCPECPTMSSLGYFAMAGLVVTAGGLVFRRQRAKTLA